LYQLYKKNFEESLWAYTKTHRNPFYNVIKLILDYNEKINANLTKNIPSTLRNDELERDIEDILARWETYHFPDRYLGHAELSDDYERVQNLEEIKEFLHSSPFGFLFAPLFIEVDSDRFYVNKPLTPEYRDSNIFIWERNPFFYKQPTIYPNYEFTGSSFSTPYWMARCFGIINATGIRTD